MPTGVTPQSSGGFSCKRHNVRDTIQDTARILFRSIKCLPLRHALCNKKRSAEGVALIPTLLFGTLAAEAGRRRWFSIKIA